MITNARPVRSTRIRASRRPPLGRRQGKQLMIPGIGGFLPGELIVDLFCGGGGASAGIELALGRSPDVAVNHDPASIAMHQRNHPVTTHFQTDVWDVEPRKAAGGSKVGLLWASAACNHFSKAKGSKPVNRKIRSLAWVTCKWAAQVRPRVIMLENVEEFVGWGPLRWEYRMIKDRKTGLKLGTWVQVPDEARAGQYFRRYVNRLRSLGYQVEWRIIKASDFGAPTRRRRFFLVARCDGQPICWPEKTHGPHQAKPYHMAAEIIDWSLPSHSIFLPSKDARKVNVRRPLAEDTERRIAQGVMRFVLGGNPFIAPVDQPVSTPVAGRRLVSAFLGKHYTGVVGSDLRLPIGTITTIDHHSLQLVHLERMPLANPGRAHKVAAFLVKYYGSGSQQQALDEPIHTIVTKARFGLVTVVIDGADYALVDITFRMLAPRELAKGQGFPDDYQLVGTAADQIARIGNAVCPPVAAALVEANMRPTFTTLAGKAA